MKKIVFLIMISIASTGAFAKTYHHKNYSHHKSYSVKHHKTYKHKSYKHKAKKETCWRTNTHTGQRFRIC